MGAHPNHTDHEMVCSDKSKASTEKQSSHFKCENVFQVVILPFVELEDFHQQQVVTLFLIDYQVVKDNI